MFEDEGIEFTFPDFDPMHHIRLGKLVEQFVFTILGQTDDIDVLKTNIQIFLGKITVGELDVLLKKAFKYYHLEIVYKFYLYDPDIKGEIKRWIGPNRKDSLVQKLDKLKAKQFPLLHRSETQSLLTELETSPEDFIQQTYFKAQLFVPYKYKGKISLINQECIKGFYIKKSELHFFKDAQFYIPSKPDWLIDPYDIDYWLEYNVFIAEVKTLLTVEKSPMCWLKTNEGKLLKVFVVWW